MPPDEARATFTAWRQALRLDSVKETPIRDTGVISLSGHGYHGTVRIGLIADGKLPPDKRVQLAKAAARAHSARLNAAKAHKRAQRRD